MNNEDGGMLICCVLFGVAGGLLGYGISETIRGACIGAGIGLVVPFLLVIFG